MVKKEILEGNILIADFMGKFEFSKAYCRSHGLPEYKPEEDLVEIQSFKYHSSWDWLKPVIDMIERMVRVGELPKEEHREYAFLHLPIFSEITTAWLAVVEFIKWYNQNKK